MGKTVPAPVSALKFNAESAGYVAMTAKELQGGDRLFVPMGARVESVMTLGPNSRYPGYVLTDFMERGAWKAYPPEYVVYVKR